MNIGDNVFDMYNSLVFGVLLWFFFLPFVPLIYDIILLALDIISHRSGKNKTPYAQTEDVYVCMMYVVLNQVAK